MFILANKVNNVYFSKVNNVYFSKYSKKCIF